MSDILIPTAEVEILAAAAGKPKRLRIVAYSGGSMFVGGFGDVVIDLAGLSLPASLPILSDHRNELSSVIASGTATVQAGTLVVTATLADSLAAEAVIALLKSGVALQASVGATPLQRRQLRAKETAVVNGKQVVAGSDGLTVIEKSVLKEVSLTPLGADAHTSVSIAAKRKTVMDPKLREFILAMGGNPDTITPEQLLHAKANFDGKPYVPAITASDPLEAEANRIGAIEAIEAHAELEAHNPQHQNIVDELKQRGIESGWTRNQVELEILRASRPQPHTVYPRREGVNANTVLEAALLAHIGQESLGVKTLGETAMQRGRDLRCNSMMDLVKASFQMHGMAVPHSQQEMIRSAFSTLSLPGVLGNAMNKTLLDAYASYPSVFRMIARKLTANDFKQHTGYRMTAKTQFEQVPPGGELKHGSFSESSYPYSVNTYGKMFGLTRQDLINDDMGAFASVPQQLARGAAQSIEDLAWALVLANTGAFFGPGNGNYISGGSSALTGTALGLAVQTMLKAVDENGKPISVFPKFLIVPPELKATADALYQSHNLVGGSTPAPEANPFFGLYQPLTTPYLSNATYPGNSAAAWYLFGNPADVAAFGIAYLNGVEHPTVESADADFSTLGIQFRGFLDFGVCQIDARGAVKSAGA